MDYRGYGKSEGSPSESGLMMDAEATIEFVFHLLEGIDTNKIFILGKSLGGAVTVYGAIYGAKYGIKGIILENTFTTLERVVS